MKRVGLLCCLLLLIGCTKPSQSPPDGGNPANQSGQISREKAIETASKQVDTNTLEVKDATLVEKYQLEGREATVWRVAFQTKDQQVPQAIYFVDATSGEVVWTLNPRDEPQQVETADQAIERVKVLFQRDIAVVRYEATRIDGWLPTVPTDADSPQTVWKVAMYDAAGNYRSWVILDAKTGGPVQVGDVN